MEYNPVFRNILPIQVRFSDVDIMGHVSNTIYQNYFDSGKLSYFDTVLPDMDFKNIAVVGASVKIDYFRPIFMKTPILVETRVSALGHKSITMEHRLIDESTQELLSFCTAILVCFSVKEQFAVPIPSHWKQQIMEYDTDVIQKV
jgi:acyl-CoA thioester hydrolase